MFAIFLNQVHPCLKARGVLLVAGKSAATVTLKSGSVVDVDVDVEVLG